MAGTHPVVLGNWAFEIDDSAATVHRCIDYEAWMATFGVGCLILPYSVIAAIGVPLMAFPRCLDTKAMSEYVTRHFAWDQHGIAFLPSPLPKDFQTLCPGFDLAVAEEAAEYYELPELPQGQALPSLKSVLTKLCWSAFESWIWLFSDRIYETRFRSKGSLGENSGAGRQKEGSGVETTDEDLGPEKAASP
ncbi:hypothetical protein Cgig2_027694 [Carnegiea gigantea]|uniref:Uncharacterized protein n=1 Tax=Carnegiea gigantea TaxID=171969 RepID=A0A9Q1Q7D8_9CARY|nr:hypothetical protein Cgig2_027694 [Carnegiea gigantea]